MRLRAFVGLVAASLLFAAAAPANNDSVVDQTGDVEGTIPEGEDASDVDLTKITHGHTRKGKLKHIVTFVGAASVERVMLQIGIPGETGESASCDFAIFRFEGEDVVTEDCGLDKVGNAKIELTGPHEVTFTFAKSVIGSPRAYNWHFVSFWQLLQLPYSDTAPSNFLMRHRL
jgi:hypothetical protein